MKKTNLVILEGLANKELQRFGSELVLPKTSLRISGFHISQFASNMLNGEKNSINYAAQEKALQRIYNCYLLYLVSAKDKETKLEKWLELGYNLSAFKKVIISMDCGNNSYRNRLVNSFIKHGVLSIEENEKLAIRKWKDELDQVVAINIYDGIKYWSGIKNENRK